ncbi:MAG TPA: AAA family ATPase [Acidimicrobiales bacterium]|nr:AAA family ATPase [Acidimicrobiales bacterium]
MAPNLVSAAERFVGRADELRRIDRIGAAASEGRGAVALVSGEAGIGKTRFCNESAQRARHAGLTVVTARCWGEGGAPPLWPWQPILTELCGDQAARLLGPGTAAADETIDADRFARFSAIVDALGAAAERGPACVVIDDIHAADASTLLLMRFVARAIHGLPLALIVSRRSDEPSDEGLADRLLAEIEREAIPIVLHHFDLDEATTFLADQGLRELEPDLVLALLKVTGGNPLFLRRIAALGAPDPHRALPAGLRVAIEQALATLSPPTQEILRASAVLGLTPVVSEASAVSEADPGVVLDAIAEASGAGLVTSSPAEAPDRFAFTHELVRSALEDALAPGERFDAHARAAGVVAGAGVDAATSAVAPADRLARRAHHALAAAPRSTADAVRAVEACRDAAWSMMNSFAYERADALLSAAVDLHHPATIGQPPAELLVPWAQAALLGGRLGEARCRFDRATSAAESARNPVLFAEAALGLGGHWLNEHRAPVDRARVLGLQRAALARLPASHEALRCRLVARLAAEDVYDGGPVDPVREALAAARRSGDLGALAEALSLCHHALLAPDFARSRIQLADELVRVAAEGGHGVLGLMGLCWRAVDLILLGHDRATRALEDLRARADALECQNILYIVDVIDVMLLIRAGRLDDAEAAAARCYERGAAVGEVDAIGYLGAHTLAIRWIQGRDAEVLGAAEEVAASNTLVEGEFGFRATAAAIAARAGHHDQARTALGRLGAGGLAALPRSSTWLAGMAAIIEAAAIEGDLAVVREAYELLAPFADLPVMPSLGVICLGSTERFLGVAARALGETDHAIAHFERAIAADRRLGNRPLVAITAADLASTLSGRSQDGDAARSAALWARAIREAEGMGMTTRAEAWRRASSTAPEPVVPAVAVDRVARGNGSAGGLRQEQHGSMRRHGRGWLVELGDRQAVVPDLVGMAYLSELVTHPAQPIAALTLAGGASAGLRRHEIIDRQARDAYAVRARELAGDLAEAEAHNDLGRADRIRVELDAVVAQIEEAAGLGGRPRAFGDEHERARTSVRKAIKRAIDEIRNADPVVGEILDAAVVTGSLCIYTPASSPHNVRWTVRGSAGATADG